MAAGDDDAMESEPMIVGAKSEDKLEIEREERERGKAGAGGAGSKMKRVTPAGIVEYIRARSKSRERSKSRDRLKVSVEMLLTFECPPTAATATLRIIIV